MRAALLAASLCLAAAQFSACSRDNRAADVKQCNANAQREVPEAQSASANESAEQRHDRLGGQIAVCMDNLGYRHDNSAMTDERCVDDVDFNPYCYRR